MNNENTMKKTIILLMLAFLPTLLMAQAAGGHVVRKPKQTAVAPKPKPAPKPKQINSTKHRQKTSSRNGYKRGWRRAEWEDEIMIDSLDAFVDTVACDTIVCDSVM